eukprot:5900467-Prymnesium_polylepis.1
MLASAPLLLLLRSYDPQTEPLLGEHERNLDWFCTSVRCEYELVPALPEGGEAFHPWFSYFNTVHARLTESRPRPAELVLWLHADVLISSSADAAEFLRQGLLAAVQLPLDVPMQPERAAA